MASSSFPLPFLCRRSSSGKGKKRKKLGKFHFFLFENSLSEFDTSVSLRFKAVRGKKAESKKFVKGEIVPLFRLCAFLSRSVAAAGGTAEESNMRATSGIVCVLLCRQTGGRCGGNNKNPIHSPPFFLPVSTLRFPSYSSPPPLLKANINSTTPFFEANCTASVGRLDFYDHPLSHATYTLTHWLCRYWICLGGFCKKRRSKGKGSD